MSSPRAAEALFGAVFGDAGIASHVLAHLDQADATPFRAANKLCAAAVTGFDVAPPVHVAAAAGGLPIRHAPAGGTVKSAAGLARWRAAFPACTRVLVDLRSHGIGEYAFLAPQPPAAKRAKKTASDAGGAGGGRSMAAAAATADVTAIGACSGGACSAASQSRPPCYGTVCDWIGVAQESDAISAVVDEESTGVPMSAAVHDKIDREMQAQHKDEVAGPRNVAAVRRIMARAPSAWMRAAVLPAAAPASAARAK
jgi:hypothetical protein